ncbi:MAG TPA: LysE family transporter, partial [Aggregatilineales bacterium]|nr:LysE family transporter [Aggregatilineales bacterium]
GVLCIRRTLAEGRSVGFVSGLGAATADSFYGAIAGFGLTVVSGFLVDQQTWLRLIGGAFLCALGVRIFRAHPAEAAASARKNSGLPGAYLSTLALTLTNPATILAFAAIFAGLGIGEMGGDRRAALALVGGVFAGSATWWLILSGGVSLLRMRLTPARLRWINRLSGVILAGFGAAALISVMAG